MKLNCCREKPQAEQYFDSLLPSFPQREPKRGAHRRVFLHERLKRVRLGTSVYIRYNNWFFFWQQYFYLQERLFICSNTFLLAATFFYLATISYSNEKAKLKYEKEQQIQQELEDANRLFENDPSASNRLRLDKIKEKLELLYEEKVKGIVIRATAHWHEYGERSTKYFLNLEKRNHVKKHIRKL